MKRNWLRYLNPFYFETRSLIWMAWGNALIACLLLSLILLGLLKFQPVALRLTHLSDIPVERFDKITDATKLREMLVTEIHYKHVFWQEMMHLAKAFSLLAASLIFVLVMNAFYLHKAHQLLKSKGESTT